MEISFLGHQSFRIKGKHASVVTDPRKEGKRVPADVVTLSHGSPVKGIVEGDPFFVTGPGEYEVKGVGIIGVGNQENAMYRIEVDGVSVVHLGIPTAMLSASEIDALDGVDILLVPTGDHAAALVKEIEPSIVIPVGDPKDLLKELGKDDTPPVQKFTVTRDKIPQEMTVVVLS